MHPAMIVARVFAGLGNQLFQYAAARELGLRHGCAVFLDTQTWYQQPGRDRRQERRRDYLLAELGIRADEAGEREREAPFARSRWLGSRIDHPDWTHIRQVGGEIPLAAFEQAKPPVFLEGYWQSEAFFPTYKPQLAAELTALRPDPGRNAPWLGALLDPNAVALHVRRGDYVAHSTRSPNYRLMGMDYYRQGLERVTGGHRATRAVVFSDDADWCEANLRIGVPFVVVRHHDAADHAVDDLLLMAQARRLVIANSTFSWWAAWIATQRGGAAVAAPARWFDDPAFAEWSRRLQVPGWHLLEA